MDTILMATPALFTFGYEGLVIDEFIERLQQVDVELIVDVRELPLSRKRGFSKSSFRAALAEAGIDYEHRARLGCPRPVRDRYKADGNWQAYTRSFQAYLNTQTEEVVALALKARAQRACLVCFEADFSMCHRSYVAQAAHRYGAPAVQHLTAKTVVADLPSRLAA